MNLHLMCPILRWHHQTPILNKHHTNLLELRLIFRLICLWILVEHMLFFEKGKKRSILTFN